MASLQRAIELGETTCGICVCTPWTTKSASKYGSKDETSDDCDEVSGNVNIGTVGTNSGGSAVSGLRINSASENTNDKKSPSLQTRETSTNTVAFKQHGKEVTTLSLTEMSHADQVTLIDSDPPIEEEDVKSFKVQYASYNIPFCCAIFLGAIIPLFFILPHVVWGCLTYCSTAISKNLYSYFSMIGRSL